MRALASCSRARLFLRGSHEDQLACRLLHLSATRLALPGGDADWQSGRYHPAGIAHVEESGPDRLRGHAAHAEAAEPLRDSQAPGELPRTQRTDARAGT